MLDNALDYVKAFDGTNVQVRASSALGNPTRYSAGALMLGLSGVFKHGKKIVVKKGSRMGAYVDGNRKIRVSAASTLAAQM